MIETLIEIQEYFARCYLNAQAGGAAQKKFERYMSVLQHFIVRGEPVPCENCRYWDTESGLSVRKCAKHGMLTTKSDWCSSAKGRV